MPAAALLHFERDAAAASALAERLDLERITVQRHRFPDGEFRLQVPEQPPECAVVFATLDDPNEKLVELMILAGCLRALQVRRIVLVAPYLCYMRQDIAFKPGEAVSQQIVGRFLAERFDARRAGEDVGGLH
ncbi:MAG: ribose-phosphate pyrophosphokinase-like domain-containing protein, partial [Quisquiliibacterium sp.]